MAVQLSFVVPSLRLYALFIVVYGRDSMAAAYRGLHFMEEQEAILRSRWRLRKE